MNGWRLITDTPDEPCNVLLIVPHFVWTDVNGKPVKDGPMRDLLERMELGFWDGEMWCEARSGHDIDPDFRPPHLLPSHWMPLPAAPVEGVTEESVMALDRLHDQHREQGEAL